GMNVAEATNAPRFHHQWLPEELRVEKGFSPDTIKLLEAKGQKVALKEAMGSTQSIMVECRRSDQCTTFPPSVVAGRAACRERI
ncbi:gamma-glutamyltransferase, partial [Pseudomonas aeruginosa]|uniref:gamma-glutamyltransferase n=1 Tax=Pseudomonas aeruginosa TaxID=287 RepID=UPI0031B6BD54